METTPHFTGVTVHAKISFVPLLPLHGVEKQGETTTSASQLQLLIGESQLEYAGFVAVINQQRDYTNGDNNGKSYLVIHIARDTDIM